LVLASGVPEEPVAPPVDGLWWHHRSESGPGPALLWGYLAAAHIGEAPEVTRLELERARAIQAPCIRMLPGKLPGEASDRAYVDWIVRETVRVYEDAREADLTLLLAASRSSAVSDPDRAGHMVRTFPDTAEFSWCLTFPESNWPSTDRFPVREMHVRVREDGTLPGPERTAWVQAGERYLHGGHLERLVLSGPAQLEPANLERAMETLAGMAARMSGA